MHTHNWHRLSHYGLRGHAYHQRAMRTQRIMERVGACMVAVFLLLFVVAACV